MITLEADQLRGDDPGVLGFCLVIPVLGTGFAVRTSPNNSVHWPNLHRWEPHNMRGYCGLIRHGDTPFLITRTWQGHDQQQAPLRISRLTPPWMWKPQGFSHWGECRAPRQGRVDAHAPSPLTHTPFQRPRLENPSESKAPSSKAEAMVRPTHHLVTAALCGKPRDQGVGFTDLIYGGQIYPSHGGCGFHPPHPPNF